MSEVAVAARRAALACSGAPLAVGAPGHDGVSGRVVHKVVGLVQEGRRLRRARGGRRSGRLSRSVGPAPARVHGAARGGNRQAGGAAGWCVNGGGSCGGPLWTCRTLQEGLAVMQWRMGGDATPQRSPHADTRATFHHTKQLIRRRRRPPATLCTSAVSSRPCKVPGPPAD